LEDENRIKSTEIDELNKDVKHLMDERAIMKKKMFKDEQKLKSLQQIIVKDLNRKLAKKVSLHLLKKFNEPP
jgi:hypothetical protein